MVLSNLTRQIRDWGGRWESKDLLTKVAKVYALSRIERDIGWFATNGTLGTKEVWAIRNKMNELCNSLYLSGDLGRLVRGFDLPKFCLGPMAASSYINEFGLQSKY